MMSLNACVLPITRDQQRQLVEQLEGDLLSINELTQAIMRAPVAALHICRAAGAAALWLGLALRRSQRGTSSRTLRQRSLSQTSTPIPLYS